MRDREKEGWKDSGRERGKDGEREVGVKEREERERERAVTMSQTSHISLSYTGTMILPFGMTLP